MSDDLFSADDLDQELLARQAAQKPAVSRQVRKEEKALAPLTGKTLYIIDGYSLIYRSYFAFLSRPLTDSQGNNVSAFFGFFNTIFMLIRDYEFDYFVVAMDSKGPTFRHRMYEPYKANREAAPQDLHSQVPMIMDALEKLNIPYIAREGYEADDLIATLAANASRLGIETVMVTGDKDLLQLVDDRVRALRPPKKNQPRYTLFGADEVKAEFGISPSQIIDYLSLLGDSSDNVPGVRGIGEKSAVKLLEEYVSLDGIYRHLDSLSKGLRSKLEEGRTDAYLSRDLVRLKNDVFTLDSSGAYKDTIDDWHSDLEDISFKKAIVEMEAINGIPLNFNIDATPINVNGEAISDVTVNIVQGNIKPGNKIKGGAGTATESPIMLELISNNGSIENLDGLRITLSANTQGAADAVLNKNMTLQLNNIRIRIEGGVTIDMN